MLSRVRRLGNAFSSWADGWLQRKHTYTVALIAVFGTLLLPLFLTDLPPLVDYPNHLARMYVLVFGATDPVLSRMYGQHWSLIPNLAVDLVMPAMLHVLPIYVAGRVVLAVVLLLPVIGAILYSRVAFGRRSFWPLASGLMAYNALFIMGFLNFLIAVGLALIGAGGWLYLRDRHPFWTTLLGAICAVFLFFCHIVGLAFFAILIGSNELASLRAAATNRRFLAWQLLGRGIRLVAVFAVPMALYLLAPIHVSRGPIIWNSALQKLVWFFEAVITYNATLSFIAAVVICLLVYSYARHGRLQVYPGIGIALAILVMTYAALPFYDHETAFVDARMPIMIALLLFAGMKPVSSSAGKRVLATGVLTLSGSNGVDRADVVGSQSRPGSAPSEYRTHRTGCPRFGRTGIREVQSRVLEPRSGWTIAAVISAD